MKYYRKTILSVLAAICCVAAGLLPVQSVSAAEGDVPRVVFENEQNTTPDLYVTKTIESASGDYEAPEDLRFTFILKLDGRLAGQREYRVFDENGAEVYNYQDGESTDVRPNKIPFRTDRSGTFTLAPGQTAKFEYVGAGVSYEVTEVPLEGWEQIRPSGGAPASGTVTDHGAWAQFTNLTGGSGSTELIVRKEISFPEGYTPPETPEFTFVLEIGGKPFAGERFIITDSLTGGEISSGTTGADGSFALKGGQSASFPDVPEDTDYRVTEKSTEDWWAVGETGKEGSTGTSGAVVAVFHNAQASFAVTKSMEDNSTPDVSFTFLLTKGDKSVWAEAPYLLYRTNGEPVLDEEGVQVSGVTDENGQFRLKPGQTAVFTGIRPGTVYNVSETAHPEYVQTVPSTGQGYTDKVVSDAVEVLPFVNRPAQGGLSVTKVLENTDGEAPQEQKEFTFVLRHKTEGADGAEGTYEPLADAVYSIVSGGSESTYKTDSEGKFYLKANETARFSGLSAGEYQVEELESGFEYEPVVKIQEGSLTQDEPDLSFTFTNRYSAKFFDLYLIKEDRSVSGKTLEGAEFMLYRDELMQNPVQDEPFVTDSEGKITVENLKTGTYYLKETKAPAGYQLLANPVKITVSWLDDEMQVTVDDKTITSSQEDDQIHIVQNPQGNDSVHIKIYNSRSFLLPVTGGTAAVFIAAAAGAAALLFGMWRLGKKKDPDRA